MERLEKDNKRRSNTLIIRLYLQNGNSRLDRARKLLLVRSKWFINRLLSITPQLREFQALSSIKNIPLLPIILNPINCRNNVGESRKRYSTPLSQPLQQILKASYNDSQIQAIDCCIGSLDLNLDFNLSLVQGPPGDIEDCNKFCCAFAVCICRQLINFFTRYWEDSDYCSDCQWSACFTPNK